MGGQMGKPLNLMPLGLQGNEEVIIRGSGVSPGMTVTAKRVQSATVAGEMGY
jgi:hypothetical protein